MKIKKENVVGFDKGMKEFEERVKQFRNDIKMALDVKSPMQVSNYRHGTTRMNYPRIWAVQEVFKRYGISEPFDMVED